MRRAGLALGSLFLLLGVFWTGRESSHGLNALWEHWWCPIPLAVIVIGVASVFAAQRMNPAR